MHPASAGEERKQS